MRRALTALDALDALETLAAALVRAVAAIPAGRRAALLLREVAGGTPELVRAYAAALDQLEAGHVRPLDDAA